MKFPWAFSVTLAAATCGGIALSDCWADEAPVTTVALAREQQYSDLAAEVALLEKQGNLLKKVVKLTIPTVVHIEAQHTDAEGKLQHKPVEDAGSGVIIRWTGKFYVLTNRHVIKKSSVEHIRIKLSDGRHIHPTRIWEDRETDIALLAVEAKGLVPARLGDSSKLEMGDYVVALGSPFGLSHSVSYGIISAKGRRDLQLGDDSVRYQDFLQTDAAINPGNSGGPLVNLRGEVVGINTAIASNTGVHEGIGFSIPMNMAMVVARQLIEHGSVVRAYLGVRLDSKFKGESATSSGLTRVEGARVTAITPKSPAETAKIHVGDIIVEFDGMRIEDDSHLINLVSLTPVDKEVELQLLRDGERQSLKVKVGNRSEIEP
ncbi:MAG: S1C family serine protease [Pirellulaceae bacterium]